MKSGRSIHWESQLERDLVYLLEFDPAVVSYREQPVTVHYEDAGRLCRYTPDFLVQMAYGLHVIEVKPARIAEEPEWRDLFERMVAHFAKEGAKYEVLTERDIRRQPRLDNVALLLRYQRQAVQDGAVSAIRGCLSGDRMMLADLARRIAERGGGVATIYALLAQHILATDLDTPLGLQSPIWVAQE
ncbi:TnsA endonuclease N-terminal domain-containing protein [Skermanella stibiiresistens]|nr:TnsA endonuclease N-terminal domain-containing protein [Skermanella stibiiresistens]